MLIETYVNIKKNGVLVAFDERWQYWQCGGVWYSLDVSGNLAGCSVWCAVSQLAHHFRHLSHVTGRRWENSPALCIVRPDMIPAY